MLIGYARVSTEDQNLDLQRDALRKAGCKKIFEEKESGRAGTKRPAFEAALAYLRPEDQLVVWKIDRLGRSLREMLDTAHMLQTRGIKLRSLTENVDTRGHRDPDRAADVQPPGHDRRVLSRSEPRADHRGPESRLGHAKRFSACVSAKAGGI